MIRTALVLPILAVAVHAAQPLEVMDVFELEYATDAQISPNGEQVVYVRHFNDVMTDRRYQNLWMVDADGSNHRPLNTGKHTANSPRWSPDGSRLAYRSDESGSTQLHVRWMDTGDTAAVTSHAMPPGNFAWSPDGGRIAFTRLVPEPALVIGEMPPAPEGAEWAPPPKYTDMLAFRFDQVGDVPPGYMHLFVVAADGGTPRQVTRGERQFGAGSFAWAPEGESLIVAADLTEGAEIYAVSNPDVYEIALADGSPHRLIDRQGPDVSASVSPDGRYIAYVGYDNRYQGHQQNDLYLADRDGSNVRNLTLDYDRHVQDAARRGGGGPQWVSDGSGIYGVVHDAGNARLVLFSLDGGRRVVVPDIGSGETGYINHNTLWSTSDGGRLAYTVPGPAMPGDVAVADPGEAGRMLTDLNADLFGERELGALEELRWTSSKDGRPVHGWIIKPPGFDASRKYPLILEMHGGPFADYGDVFDTEKQLMAAAGYVVLYTNPRGSISYGEEFGNLIHHAYPGDDFHDLNSAVDHVVGMGFVDEERLYVTGGSGGGVLTAWMIGNTDRFRAAVAFYPVINWESFIFTADLSGLFLEYWMPGLPWRHRDNFEARSLLRVSENVTTPTLIMTGEEDWRTPMSESEQYYKALKLQGVETVLVRVPEEAHGIVARPSHAMSKMTTLLGWFGKHAPEAGD